MVTSAHRPGTVARIRLNGWQTAMRTATGSWAWVDEMAENPIHGLSICAPNGPMEIRPVVTIDPESNSETLSVIQDMEYPRWGENISDAAERLQTSLRRRLNSPPREPLGFGAVVQDVEGRRWVRSHHNDDDPSSAWTTPRLSGVWSYTAIAPLAVLSEGVGP